MDFHKVYMISTAAFLCFAVDQAAAEVSVESEIRDTIEKTYISRWRSVIVDRRGDIFLGEFATYDEAAKCSFEWRKNHLSDLRLTAEREIKVPLDLWDAIRDAKKAVDTAKKVMEDGWLKTFAPKERQIGDTLREYRDRIKKQYDYVRNAKETLATSTAELSERQFRQMNDLITQYNNEARSFNAKARQSKLPGVSEISPFYLKNNQSLDIARNSTGRFEIIVRQHQGGLDWKEISVLTRRTNNQLLAREYADQFNRKAGWFATITEKADVIPEVQKFDLLTATSSAIRTDEKAVMEVKLDTNGTRWTSRNGHFVMKLNADGTATYYADGTRVYNSKWEIRGSILTVTYGNKTAPGAISSQRKDIFTILAPRRVRYEARFSNDREEDLSYFKENDRLLDAE